MSKVLDRMYSRLVQTGLDPIRFFRYLKGLFRFIREKRDFKNKGGTISNSYPILNDYYEMAGSAKGHYFHQDLIIAREIFARKPNHHIDVGSRVDGFVAHVAAFREIEVFDLRPLEIGYGIRFSQVDSTVRQANKSDSVSCLHALEHFGLGRYGDEIDPQGHLKGFVNLVNLVSKNGHLYLSFPVSSRPRVEFNAHRVLSPTEIFDWPGAEQLILEKYWLIGDEGEPVDGATPFDNLNLEFGCSIYAFRKA